ncbi:class I SAM-dependent methyltransferase [Microvirga pudoricolor]|uniref:class I SAM-dependent methyltransferase n=1 Tax=Microvirga pudoricolor TaxID=2778729 RepID=UPI00195247BD|nr:class I SAM-dependent methyltransferase [Microvirga pudoricolor]MBM6593387.1 methyltransferase domain-containing protein [Microvirga pudoricolor]
MPDVPEPPVDDPLYRDPALARFYDAANRWSADFDLCRKLTDGATSILDLGCGTGELTAELGRRARVTGVDPAAAMLDIARKRRGGEAPTWVEADARTVRLHETFDWVLLTGHVFQVFLTREDQLAALRTIAAHLNPTGRFIFDTRNPLLRGWEGRTRQNTLQRIDHPALGRIETWNEAAYDEATGILTYENGFRVLATGETSSGKARIRYTSHEDLCALLTEAGLEVERWLGDWDERPLHPDTREIIPIGRRG